MLASEPGRVLWTDDYVVAQLAQKEFGVHRLWTQLFLQTLAESGTIDEQTLSDASAKLIGYGYYFTSLSMPVLVAACRIANGDPDQWPLQQALKAFADEAVSPDDSLSLITQFLVVMFSDTILANQEAILIRALDHLGSRKEGIRMIHALRKILPTAKLNVLRAQVAESMIAKWLSKASCSAVMKLEVVVEALSEQFTFRRHRNPYSSVLRRGRRRLGGVYGRGFRR